MSRRRAMAGFGPKTTPCCIRGLIRPGHLPRAWLGRAFGDSSALTTHSGLLREGLLFTNI